MTKQKPSTFDPAARVKRLQDLIKKPKEEKKRPSDFALWWAWVFFNLVAFLFDLIAASTVFQITGGNWLYATLTFFAGFLPLMMHEFGFIRANANKTQKAVAVIGAITAIGSIVLVGILAGIINVLGIANFASRSMEIGIVVTLIVISVLHGILAGIYFYADSGIKRKHTRAETLAYAYAQVDELRMAGQIMEALNKALEIEDDLIAKHGAPGVIRDIVAQLSGNDLDASPGDDAAAPAVSTHSQLPLAASETAVPMPALRETGTGSLWENLTGFGRNGAHAADPTEAGGME
ncbi:MAG: hypothetical protein L3J16_07135 [Anaerolineales bacterium]|nr:hypothetical protein [Anaerolineales bacterium]